METKKNTQINYLLPEDDLKRQEHVLRKNNQPKSKFTCGPIHFKVFTFFRSLGLRKKIHIPTTKRECLKRKMTEDILNNFIKI